MQAETRKIHIAWLGSFIQSRENSLDLANHRWCDLSSFSFFKQAFKALVTKTENHEEPPGSMLHRTATKRDVSAR